MEPAPTIDEIIETLVNVGDEFDLSLQLNRQRHRLPQPVYFAMINILINTMQLTIIR